MYGLLKPTTLAAIIADLQEAEDNSWMPHEPQAMALDDATMQLASLVGPEGADRLITQAKGK